MLVMYSSGCKESEWKDNLRKDMKQQLHSRKQVPVLGPVHWGSGGNERLKTDMGAEHAGPCVLS